VDLWQSAPADNVGLAPEAWHVFVFNDTASGTWSFTGYAICGSG
jgi:hypothetical protein